MTHKLILGTVQFGLNYGINNIKGKPSFLEVKDILDISFLNGIRLLDTAESYGDSQERIGAYHEKSSNSFLVITKFSATRLDLPYNIKERVYANLKTLRIESLYSYMFHSYVDFIKYYPDFKEDLIFLKKEKSIQKIGVSLYTNEELEEVLKYDEVDLIQLPFNLLDNSSQRKEILLKAKSMGVEIHTRSVFLQGLFFKDTNMLEGSLKSLEPYLEELKSLEKENNKMGDLALNYVFQQEYIDNVLIGVDTVAQLITNIDSIQKQLPKSIIERIDKIQVQEKKMLNPSNW